jgi:ABC-type multidrug transport system ATPase subunit
MGATGAGKISLLDIPANKSKPDFVTGNIPIKIMQISNDQFTSGIQYVKYVDQDDIFTSTLGVCEAVLFSAMLQLTCQYNIVNY